jgi:hypothetical protein
MFKGASLFNGGSSSAGWSTQHSTPPTDYRIKESRLLRSTVKRHKLHRRQLLAVVSSHLRRRLPPPIIPRWIGRTIRREIDQSGGLLAWALNDATIRQLWDDVKSEAAGSH